MERKIRIEIESSTNMREAEIRVMTINDQVMAKRRNEENTNVYH